MTRSTSITGPDPMRNQASLPILSATEPSPAMVTAESWRMSPALFGALVVAGLATLAAVVFRRPDVLLLAVPFIGYVAWAAETRPSTRPAVAARVGNRTLFERQQTDLVVEITGAEKRISMVTVVQPPAGWLEVVPVSGGVNDRLVGSQTLTLTLRARRWGVFDVSPVSIALMSQLAAWRLPLIETSGTRIKVLPARDDFEAVNAVPRPAGLVGFHTARRPGDSGELAGVRQFQAGDRLKRINWRVSSRMPELHVNSTWSERDTEVQIWIDSREDLGWSGGVDNGSSSLDIAVRAAAAVAEHYLRQGDRVSLVDLGAGRRTVASGSGRQHLRKILDVLVDAAANRAESVRRAPIRPGSLVIMLSPLLYVTAAGQLVEVVQRGSSAIVIDTLPGGLTDPARHAAAGSGDSELAALAWRLRLAGRMATVLELAELGVPLVSWSGPGSLDEVLRDVSRIAAAPRIRR
jgi:uncharacterized protein (DUF58 family)